MATLEVTIDAIIHATEDHEKFYESLNEMFGLEKGQFSTSGVTGHFDNPITTIRAKITKKMALQVLGKFLKKLSREQLNQILSEIEERTENSTLHVRLGKQDFIQGKITFNEKEAIKLKIHTPVYNKKDTVKVFRDILQKDT